MRDKAVRRAWYARNKKRILGYQRRHYALKGRRRKGKVGFIRHTKGSNCWIGNQYEKRGVRLLKGSKWINSDVWSKEPYDLVWRGKTVDVKMRNFAKHYSGWAFILQHKKTDLLLLFCVKKGRTLKVLLIPTRMVKGRSVGVSANKSKWDKYIIG